MGWLGMTTRNILVIEDNPEIAALLALHLTDLGCLVRVEQGGIHGLARARSDHPDLIILDLMLPGMDGMEVCRRLREEADYTPILMLTSRSSVEDRVLGFDTGADDYLIKPFSISELLARVKAIFRRLETPNRDTKNTDCHVVAGALAIDLEKHRVSSEGVPIDLTAKEFELLQLFAMHPGRVYTRAQLLDFVWGQNNVSQEHAVNSHINRLRAKIERDSAKPEYVLTVWGIGYKFNDQLPA